MNIVSKYTDFRHKTSPIVYLVFEKCYNRAMNSDSDPKTRQEIGKNLREIREKRKLTQAEVAEKAGITVTYYARMERGQQNPTSIVLKNLAKVLKVKSSDILPF